MKAAWILWLAAISLPGFAQSIQNQKQSDLAYQAIMASAAPSTDEARAKSLRQLHDAVAQMSRLKKVPYDQIKGLLLRSTEWVDAESLHRLPTDVFEDWLNQIRKLLLAGGRHDVFETWAGRVTDGEWKRNKKWAMHMSYGFSQAFRARGKFDEGLRFIHKMRELLGPDPVLALNFDYIDAQELVELGKTAEAIVKLNGLLVISDRIQKDLLPWIHLYLAQAELAEGNFAAALKHAGRNTQLIAGDSNHLPWEKVYGRSLSVSILREQRKFKEARAAAEIIKRDIERTTRGPVDVLAWNQLELLFLAHQRGDRKAVLKLSEEMSVYLKELPGLDFLNTFREAIVNSVEGRSTEPALERARNLFGANHPNVRRLERALL